MAHEPLPEPIVFNGKRGLPYSRGLMARSLSASGLAPDRAQALARLVGQRLAEMGVGRIDVAPLQELTEQILLEQEGEEALQRLRHWHRLDHLDRPLIVMLGGTAGVGKSTLATMMASRLGLTRVIPTDVLREALRASFSPDFLPTVHRSSFEAGLAVRLAGADQDLDLLGFARQAESVGTSVRAIVERAVAESTSMVVEGVHVIPGMLDSGLSDRCILIEALLVVGSEERHRAHFPERTGKRPADRYLGRFEQIRKLQDYVVELAHASEVPVIENQSIDEALADVMDLVLNAVERLPVGTDALAG